jgi:hypothetical protein
MYETINLYVKILPAPCKKPKSHIAAITDRDHTFRNGEFRNGKVVAVPISYVRVSDNKGYLNGLLISVS